MQSLKQILEFLYNNWGVILACLVLILGIIKKTKDFFSKTKEEQLEIAKKQISETILKLCSNAEDNYSELKKAGSIKRAEVIAEIYKMYPVLSDIVDQDEIIKYLDEAIDNALKDLRHILEENAK